MHAVASEQGGYQKTVKDGTDRTNDSGVNKTLFGVGG